MVDVSIDSTAIANRTRGLPVKQIRATVVEGPDSGRTVSVSDLLSIGTAEGNNLVLTDPTVSRFHVDLERVGDRISVSDHGSTNGIIVKQARIERGAVVPGTILELGRSRIRVDDGESAEIELHDQDALGDLFCGAPVMRQLVARVRRLATSPASVLLLGETGSGKEIVARTLHELRHPAGAPFEIVDCGSLQPTLIGSELFGHEKGAFTGADRQHQGAFERAKGGTIFLDEIGELPLSLQATLLGALERRTFRRLGGKTPIEFNAQVICATHRDLREEVNSGSFRQDLLYRIAVFTLRIPPLREHKEDIPRLVEHFARHAGHSGPIEEVFPPPVMEALARHRWPGNVRELRNAVEAALVWGDEFSAARAPMEPEADVEHKEPRADRSRSISLEPMLELEFSQARAQFEGEYIKGMIELCSGNVAEAARRARVNRSYLFRMLKKYGITVKRSSRP